MRVLTAVVRFATACSLLSFASVQAQMPSIKSEGTLQSEYNKYCGSKDKEQMETAASVTDANKRPNSCMCGFLQASHKIQAKDSLGGSVTKCVNGFAGEYPCSNVDLMSFMNAQDVNIDIEPDFMIINDIWGWTDPETRREYALVGTSSGTSFIDITSATNPVHLGKLRSHLGTVSAWRDIKTYDNHAFIVAENKDHGMQVFDLTQLRGLHNEPDIPRVFQETTHYGEFSNSHNIAINEDDGYAYAVGTDKCGGGMHMIDILDPQAPVFAGCFNDGYTHDVQCVIYQGSDTRYTEREICFASNANYVTIVDVSDKNNPALLSRFTYANSYQTFTHQGWLSEDQDYFFFGDEGDEGSFSIPTTTYVVNVMDLTNPVLAGIHTAATAAVDHNQYVKGNLVYQANYMAGLRILNITDAADGKLNEVGYFDTNPPDDELGFNGAWSNYPYFNSGNVIISVVDEGLFVVRPTGAATGRTGPTLGGTLGGLP